MGSLSGKTILITGASKGIGCATTELLGIEGAYVIAHYGSDREGAIDATKNIPEDHKFIVQADLEQSGSPKKLWREALEWRGVIDVVIANAAIMPEAAFTDSDELWDATWEAAMSVNATAPAQLIREATKYFLENSGGSIIAISSWAAQRGAGNIKLGAYSASKAAIAALVKTIARAYGRDGIYAYLISPGVVRTGMSVASAITQGGEEKITATLAMGEWVPPKEIAEMVVILATGASKHLSGGTIDVNGATYIR